MATTRIMPLHTGKGRSVGTAISDILDYVKNPQKTDHGRLITAHECDSRTADVEFLFSKRQYKAITGRTQENDVIAYHVRQSFRPGEVTPEEANRIGVEFAQRFLKGNNAFIVCTHIDRLHTHNHIIWNSTALSCDCKFRNFWGSTRAVRNLSDTLCVEHRLSIVENPKRHGKSYNKWLGDQAKPAHRDLLRAAIDGALSGQNIISSNVANQSASTSAEASIPEYPAGSQGDMVTEVPAVYAELLDTYVTALNEKWDGNALMEKGLNLMALDLYDGAPLDSIGYAVVDIDGNGTDELVIGTTASVTDDFYGKVIFDLYTLGQDGARIQVLSSTARNRYFYAGEKLFVDLGSSSADDSTNATLRYEGVELTDTNKVTAPADYVQMDLNSLSEWTGSAVTMNGNTKGNASSELVALLDEINQKVTTGTSGNHIAATPIAVKLLNWGVGTGMTTDAISMAVIGWMEPKGNDELVAFSEKMSVIDGIYQELLGEDAKDLLSSAGCEDAPYPWSNQPIDTIETIMDTLGLR